MTVKPRNHSVIVVIVMFVSLQIVFVDLLLRCAHVAIGSKSVILSQLFVQLVFIKFLLVRNHLAPFFFYFCFILDLSCSILLFLFFFVQNRLLFLILSILHLLFYIRLMVYSLSKLLVHNIILSGVHTFFVLKLLLLLFNQSFQNLLSCRFTNLGLVRRVDFILLFVYFIQEKLLVVIPPTDVART